jgi:hypothetical protein
MNLLRRLFPPKPVRQAIACLDELQPLFKDNWAFDDVGNEARAYFLKHPDAVCRHAQDPAFPKDTCLHALAAIARRDLLSGEAHPTAGFHKNPPLSIEGSHKMAFYRLVGAELAKLGTITVEDAERGYRELREELSERFDAR